MMTLTNYFHLFPELNLLFKGKSSVAEGATQNILLLWDNDKLSVKFERTYNLNDKIIFVWSKSVQRRLKYP